MIKKFLILLFLIITSGVYPQVTQQWINLNNSSQNSGDRGFKIGKDGSGNIYVCAEADSSNRRKAYLLKFSSSGTLIWQKTFNPSTLHTYPKSMAVDNSGNIYVTGYINGNKIITFRVNTNGVLEWSKTFPPAPDGQGTGYSIALSDDGYIYVAGRSYLGPGIGMSNDIILLKYDSSGNEIWFKTFDGAGHSDDQGYYLSIKGSNDIYVGGKSQLDTTNHVARWAPTIIKYNSAGIEQWSAVFTDPIDSNGAMNAMTIDNASNCYITGSLSPQSPNHYIFTVKYNSSGVQQWVSKYTGTSTYLWNEGNAIVVDGSSNVYVTGFTEAGWQVGDYVTIKYNSSGAQQWIKFFNSPGDGYDYATRLLVDSQGDIYTGGITTTKVTENLINGTYTIVKYNAAGNLIWNTNYKFSNTYFFLDPDIILGNDNSEIYLTGFSGLSTPVCVVTIKYSQTIGIQTISSQIPAEYRLSQNYPNPFNPSTNIEFAITKSSFVKLIIYDMLGREIETLVSQKLNPGIYRTSWNINGNPSGVYFYKLMTEDFSDIKKMVLIK